MRSFSCAAAFTLLAVAHGAEIPRVRPEEVGMSSEVLAQIQPALQKGFAERKVPGGVVVGARHGKQFVEAYGGYDSADYIFRLFSQSKPVTAVATLILVDDGVLALDDPVTKWLPEFAALRVIKNGTMGAPIETVPLRKNMTIRHLLTHTSGLTYGDLGNTTIDNMYKAANLLDLWGQDLNGMIEKLARIPLLRQPGAAWEYSVGFDVLGAVVQRAAQMPYDQFLRTRLFNPLDMRDTGFWVEPQNYARLVPYWTTAAVPGYLVPIPNSYTRTDFLKVPKLLSGGGGLVSTARDYLRFGQMLLNGGQLDGVRILKPETVKEMLTNQLPKELKPFKMGAVTFTNSDFGLGVALQRTPVKNYAPVGEASWGGAASTNWWLSPETDTVIVGMTQVAPFSNVVAEAAKSVIYSAFLPSDPDYTLIESQKEVESDPQGNLRRV